MEIKYQDLTKSALWTVSSIKGGYEIGSMFYGKKDTFWQSDSQPPHHITVQLSKKTYITKISLYISIKNDETYTPSEIKTFIGSSPDCLVEYSSEEISSMKGWTDINLDVSTIFLKIEICKNHQGGRDSRIRQIKLWGAPQNLSIDNSYYFSTLNATKFLTIR